MAEVLEPIEQSPLVVHTSPVMEMDEEQWEKFLPLCPDFVLELRSPSDSLRVVMQKMEEYMQNGTRLGWILDAPRKQVKVYRIGEPPELLENPLHLSGEPILHGFVLDVRQIWTAMERKRRQSG